MISPIQCCASEQKLSRKKQKKKSKNKIKIKMFLVTFDVDCTPNDGHTSAPNPKTISVCVRCWWCRRLKRFGLHSYIVTDLSRIIICCIYKYIKEQQILGSLRLMTANTFSVCFWFGLVCLRRIVFIRSYSMCWGVRVDVEKEYWPNPGRRLIRSVWPDRIVWEQRTFFANLQDRLQSSSFSKNRYVPQ